MENESHVIHTLSPEQMIERAQSLTLEVAYWQHILDDAAKVNHGVHDAAAAILEVVSAALDLVAISTPGQLARVEKVLEQSRKALEALQAIGDAVGGSIELAAGRQVALEPIAAALRRAAGAADDNADEEPTS